MVVPANLMADAVLLVHAAFVAFVVFSLPAVWVGHVLGWAWVRGRGFRISHVLAIGLVVAESWVGMACPLTILEIGLRGPADGSVHNASFVEHWLHRLLYYEAPSWVFTLIYTLFGLLVIITWFSVPPGCSKRHTGQ
jgi:hypothetical protein